MPDTIGQILKQARLERNLTLEQASRAIHVRQKYLQALEEDALDQLPSRVQVRGFLRLYAGLLNLSPVELLNILDGVQPEALPEDTPPLPAPPQPPRDFAEPHTEPEQALPNESPSLHGTAFMEIGEMLHRQREILGISLRDVEQFTHIRLHYLEMLEKGQFDRLPSSVQARGMLNNYARFLNLDVENVLLKFAGALQQRLVDRNAPVASHSSTNPSDSRSHPTRMGALRRVITPDLIAGTAAIVLITVLVIWGVVKITRASSTQAVPTPPSISDVLLVTHTPAPQETSTPQPGSAQAGEETAAVSGIPTNTLPAFNGALQVYIVTRQRVWMRITVDNKIVFEGRTTPGNAFPFSGNDNIEITISNAAAVQVFYNQSDLGTLGPVGTVRTLIFTRDGMITPTPMFTSTPTLTPAPTMTAQPTPTIPTPTVTPFIP